MQKPIGDIFNYDFFVPYYQRGYRWGEEQVVALLNDLLEFYKHIKKKTEGYNYYSLQPLVVKKDVDNKYRVIDGQQRLTTVFIILNAFESFAQTRDKNKYELSYDREGSADFLQNIKSDSYREEHKKDNIDFSFFANAYDYVTEWIEDQKLNEDYIEKFMTFIRSSSDIDDDKDIENNIRFIWYELKEDDDEFETFIRLNIGKIPLTNAELIKSFVIQSFKNEEKRFEVSKEWDEIEYSLQENEFFGFISKKRFNTRIELLFQILLGVESYKEYQLYEMFMLEYKQKQEEVNWSKIKEVFHTLQYWYEDREFYHLIGYLIAIDDKIIDIWKLYNKHKSRSDFKGTISKRIQNKLSLSIEYLESTPNGYEYNIYFNGTKIEELEYQASNTSLTFKVLLLTNILSLIQSNKDSYVKFSFDLFNIERWSVEHVSPQTDKIKNSLNTEQFQSELRKLNNSKVNSLIDQISLDDEENEDDLINEIESLFTDDEMRKNKDRIFNLTLLSSRVNSSLKNNFFPVKRTMIINKDKSGEFIPIVTKNLFLKYYSDFTEEECNMFKWGESDGNFYIDSMKKLILNVFGDKNEKF